MIKMSLPQNKTTLGRLEPQNKAKLTLDRLEPGEAIWVPAGQIHAYVSGDCVEVKMVKMEMVKMVKMMKPDRSTPMSAGTVLRCRPLANTHWEGFIAPEEESFAKRFSSVWQIIFSKCSNMSWVQYWFLSLFSPPSSASKLSSFSFYDYSFYGHSGQIGIWGTCAGSQLWR